MILYVEHEELTTRNEYVLFFSLPPLYTIAFGTKFREKKISL